MENQDEKIDADSGCGVAHPAMMLSRRRFLFGAGATIAAINMPGWIVRRGMPARVHAETAHFDRVEIAHLSDLDGGEPILFRYPWDHHLSSNFLVKLGEPAGGGVGPGNDIVAFNSFCTHQGGPMAGVVKPEIGVVGPCPLHWTSFDLTRHGMVVTGHATLGLPQILLELEGDAIFAVGVLGLIFGYVDNDQDPAIL